MNHPPNRYSKKLMAIIAVLVLGAALTTALLVSSYAPDNTTPYSGVRWGTTAAPDVLVNGTWYGAQAIDGIAVADILEFAREEYGRKARKRFAEDIVEVLTKMGHRPGRSVDLALIDLSTGTTIDMARVDMTEENRIAVKNGGVFISTAAAIADLDDLERQLEERFAYLSANGVGYQSVINAARSDINSPISPQQFNNVIAKIIAQFIDGHAKPRVRLKPLSRLPFAIHLAGDRYVAVQFKNEGLVDADHPYIEAIDGRPIDEWMNALDPYLSRGSAQLKRRRATQMLMSIDGVRELLGLPTTPTVTVDLVSIDRGTQHTVVLDTVYRYGRAKQPVRDNAILPGNIGYLSLPTFLGRANVPEIVAEWMPEFHETDGLIIDVRGNGGGSRTGLVELLPYFLSPGEVRIGNVAAYRLYPEFDADHLGGSRYSYRENSDHWTLAQRQAIAAFKRTFQPEITPPEGQFSVWHYLVLSRNDGDGRYHYDKPIVLLIDEGCFSATDVFAGAFKGLGNVTVMGQPTGGGSARRVSERLPYSGIEISLASMMSFQPNGRLYDGHGIEPDVSVIPDPEVFIDGGKDNVISAALERLQGIE